MAVVRWRGFAPRSTYSRSLDNFFDDRYRRLIDWKGFDDLDVSLPAVNVKDVDNHYHLEVAAPGYDKGDFDVSVDNGVLTISAEHQMEDGNGSEENYTRREFSYSSFSRSFSLPEDAEDEEISARFENGVLKIDIPREKKAEENEAKHQITVE